MKWLIRILIFIIILIIIFGCVDNRATVKISGREFLVSVADEPAEWIQGLSGIEYLPDNTVKLFIFPDKQVRSFWMKDMLIPIDLLWIDDKIVVGYEDKIPVPLIGQELIHYSSPVPVDKVIEMSAGLRQDLGLNINDQIDINI